jgi:5,10-methylenetetrahydrofolate reductase
MTIMKKKIYISFAEKIQKRKKTILYELLPPPKNLSSEDIETSLSFFAEMIKDFAIDCINIPEVREETRIGNRGSAEMIKLEPRIVCSYLQQHGIDNLIVNRPIVYEPWEKQQTWIEETYYTYNISNFIFVGGESSNISYLGIPVTEATTRVCTLFTSQFSDILIGGITIPSRRDEALRVHRKATSGMEFFTTQILYDTLAIKQFFQEYWKLCLQKNVEPKTIFLSFAPVATKGDIKLLQWLGVEIPNNTLSLLTTGWLGMTWRSLGICEQILEDILSFLEKNAIDIPIGLNIEHVSRHNFESSFSLLERLSHIYFDVRNTKEFHTLYD